MNIVIFTSIIMIYFLAGMEVDIFIPAYPELQKIFHLTPPIVQLTLSVNFFAYCVGSLYAGMFGDKYGAKRVIIWGLIIFVLGCAICISANSFYLILVGRVLQGLGISAPAGLGFVVLSKFYSQQEQSSKLGLLNGFVTCGMALAPIIGSYLNIYLGWRGGFIFLITLGALCLLMSQLFLPNDDKRNDQVSFSVLEYSKIINSRLFWALSIVVCFLCLHYWIFIGMGPIIYMQGMGLTLNQFGLYQGVIAASFASMSFLSPIFLRKFNHFNCVTISLLLHVIFSSGLLIVMTFSPTNYVLITILMCFCAVSSVLPVNVVYPKILSSFNGSESKAASLVNIVRLIGTAVGVEVVSYFYVGRTLELGWVLFLLSTLVLVVFFTPYFRNAFNNKKLKGND
ncbi:MFS transporter [Holospora curviuscula]|uniref:Multidrug resistance protein MdtL n=1 Tax=Holospora curviuscula TaxID=1082868 RepID=A0A2S5R842_9PROT|nr:MFS transporter [Holospora curviuscula]PPE03457.1 Multidrug resistance protein MdtL [Holospora curviuscula]